ncbi:MAG TPA: hypothetical protein EYP56_14570, partial [Planctomycetaceae bacterium]|nr:hypothetical protein [Planctomycetaceae bacterium]
MRSIALFWLCVGTVGGAQAGNELFVFSPTSSGEIEAWVDVTRRADRPVSRLLYGKFTEHLGRNIYLGMWAQLLVNPGFEPAALWGQRAGRVGRELAWRLETPGLAEAARRDLHLALATFPREFVERVTG